MANPYKQGPGFVQPGSRSRLPRALAQIGRIADAPDNMQAPREDYSQARAFSSVANAFQDIAQVNRHIAQREIATKREDATRNIDAQVEQLFADQAEPLQNKLNSNELVYANKATHFKDLATGITSEDSEIWKDPSFQALPAFEQKRIRLAIEDRWTLHAARIDVQARKSQESRMTREVLDDIDQSLYQNRSYIDDSGSLSGSPVESTPSGYREQAQNIQAALPFEPEEAYGRIKNLATQAFHTNIVSASQVHPKMADAILSEFVDEEGNALLTPEDQTRLRSLATSRMNDARDRFEYEARKQIAHANTTIKANGGENNLIDPSILKAGSDKFAALQAIQSSGGEVSANEAAWMSDFREKALFVQNTVFPTLYDESRKTGYMLDRGWPTGVRISSQDVLNAIRQDVVSVLNNPRLASEELSSASAIKEMMDYLVADASPENINQRLWGDGTDLRVAKPAQWLDGVRRNMIEGIPTDFSSATPEELDAGIEAAIAIRENPERNNDPETALLASEMAGALAKASDNPGVPGALNLGDRRWLETDLPDTSLKPGLRADPATVAASVAPTSQNEFQKFYTRVEGVVHTEQLDKDPDYKALYDRWSKATGDKDRNAIADDIKFYLKGKVLDRMGLREVEGEHHRKDQVGGRSPEIIAAMWNHAGELGRGMFVPDAVRRARTNPDSDFIDAVSSADWPSGMEAIREKLALGLRKRSNLSPERQRDYFDSFMDDVQNSTRLKNNDLGQPYFEVGLENGETAISGAMSWDALDNLMNLETAGSVARQAAYNEGGLMGWLGQVATTSGTSGTSDMPFSMYGPGLYIPGIREGSGRPSGPNLPIDAEGLRKLADHHTNWADDDEFEVVGEAVYRKDLGNGVKLYYVDRPLAEAVESTANKPRFHGPSNAEGSDNGHVVGRFLAGRLGKLEPGMLDQPGNLERMSSPFNRGLMWEQEGKLMDWLDESVTKYKGQDVSVSLRIATQSNDVPEISRRMKQVRSSALVNILTGVVEIKSEDGTVLDSRTFEVQDPATKKVLSRVLR